jgi:hypothetical protein
MYVFLDRVLVCIRLESLYVERIGEPSIVFCNHTHDINKIHHCCRPSQTREYGGLGLHERERGLRDYDKGISQGDLSQGI